ncbi:MAG: TetR/AcrR family transcriptional regulator [Caulobacteraceae bacterium]
MAHAELTRETAHDGRPYHHGDLSRALIQAGRRILEKEGPNALSLRAVAREAGVSPAAPYHHFKDKCDLLAAVAGEGWQELGLAVTKARAAARDPRRGLGEIGAAYVSFARQNPNLYRLMYDSACDLEDMPEKAKGEASGWGQVRASLLAVGMDPDNELELKLATIAAWCAAHGVAEMVGFKEFDSLKQAMGGEEAFTRAILDHLGIYARHARHHTDA